MQPITNKSIKTKTIITFIKKNNKNNRDKVKSIIINTKNQKQQPIVLIIIK
jgi:hypothetical protein